MASSNVASGRSKTLDRSYVFLLTLVVTLGAGKTTEARCPEFCDCTPDVDGQDVACIGYNLKTIPEGLPEDTVELNIRNNDMEILDLDSLKTLSRLQGLDVSNNKIKTIWGTFEDFPYLSQVHLYDNELTTLSPDTFGKAVTWMHYVSLFGNPWNCDCNLKWMKEEMDSESSALSSQLVQCDTPEELHGNYTTDIDVDKFVCKQMPGVSSLQTVLMLAVIPGTVALIAIVASAIFCYRRSKRQPLTLAQTDTGPVGSPPNAPLLPRGEAFPDVHVVNDFDNQIVIHDPLPVPRQHGIEDHEHQQNNDNQVVIPKLPPVPGQHRFENQEHQQNNGDKSVIPVRNDKIAHAPNTPDIKTTPTFSFLECVPTTSTITLEWRFQHGREPDTCELHHGRVWSRGIQRDHEGRWRTFINNVKPDTEYSFQVRGIFGGQQGRISEPIKLQTPDRDNLQKECEEGCTARQFPKDFCILGDKTDQAWMETLCKALEGKFGLTGWLLERDTVPGTFKLENIEWQKLNCKKVILVFGESSDKTYLDELNVQTAVTGFLDDTKQGGEQRLIPIKMSPAAKLPDYMSPLEELTFENNKYFWSRLITGLTDKHACVFDDGEVKSPNSISV
ncbi:uncharacterized protein LOC144927743 [Branchiostoma floridae x Branchiostoma belcheri]